MAFFTANTCQLRILIYRLWHAILLTTADTTRKRAAERKEAPKKAVAESKLNSSQFLYSDDAGKSEQVAMEALIDEGASDKPLLATNLACKEDYNLPWRPQSQTSN